MSLRYSSLLLPDAKKYATGFAQGLLGRQLTNAELGEWSSAYQSGGLDSLISKGFSEFHGSVEPESFVANLYQEFFHRSGDEAGFTGWVSAMRNGELDSHGVVRGFLQSQEFESALVPRILQWEAGNGGVGSGGLASPIDGQGASNTLYNFAPITQAEIDVAGLYQGLFGRLPDSGGYKGWLGVYETSGVAAVIAGMMAQPEFENMYPHLEGQTQAQWNANFVTYLYNDFFARAPDEVGYTNWVNALDSNSQTPQEVVQGFLELPEFSTQTTPPVIDWFQSFYTYGQGTQADQYITAGSRSAGDNDWGINGVYGVKIQLIDGVSGSIGPAYVVNDPDNLAHNFTLVGQQGRDLVTGTEAPLARPSSMTTNNTTWESFETTDVQEIYLTEFDADVTLHGTLATRIQESHDPLNEEIDRSGFLVVHGDSTGSLTIISEDDNVDLRDFGGSVALDVVANGTLVEEGSEACGCNDGQCAGDDMLSDQDLGSDSVLLYTGAGDAVVHVTGQGRVVIDAGANPELVGDAGKVTLTGGLDASAPGEVEVGNLENELDARDYIGDVEVYSTNHQGRSVVVQTGVGADKYALGTAITELSPELVNVLGDGSHINLGSGINTMLVDVVNRTGTDKAPTQVVVAGTGSVIENIDNLIVRVSDDLSNQVPNSEIEVAIDLAGLVNVTKLTLESVDVPNMVYDENNYERDGGGDSTKSFLVRNYDDTTSPQIALVTQLTGLAYEHDPIDRLGVAAYEGSDRATHELVVGLDSCGAGSNDSSFEIKTSIYDASSPGAKIDALVINVEDSHLREIDLGASDQGVNFDGTLQLTALNGQQSDDFKSKIEILGVRAENVDATEVVHTDVVVQLANNQEHFVYLGDGDDVVYGSSQDDYVDAGSGNDLVVSGLGDDTVFGGLGADQIDLAVSSDEESGHEHHDGHDVVAYVTGDPETLGVAADSYLSDEPYQTMDTVSGFDFSVDKFALSNFAPENFEANRLTINLDAEDFSVAGFEAALNDQLTDGYLKDGSADALLVDVRWANGDHNATYLVVNTDLSTGYSAGANGDLTVHLDSAHHLSDFGVENFTGFYQIA